MVFSLSLYDGMEKTLVSVGHMSPAHFCSRGRVPGGGYLKHAHVVVVILIPFDRHAEEHIVVFLSCLEFAILNSLYNEVILKPK